MGCGSSSDSVKADSKGSVGGTPGASRASSNTRTPILRNKAKVAPIDFQEGNSITRGADERTDSLTSCRDSGIDSAKTSDGRRLRTLELGGSGARQEKETELQAVLPKPIAFEVVVADDKKGDSIINKHPPRRLQMLENAPQPKLTAEMIEQKLKLSEERRLKALESKSELSKKSSKRRKDLMAAMQYSQQNDQQTTSKKIEDKIDSAAKNREKVKAARIAKQKQRELRARQARAKRLQDSFDDEGYDVEKDETFNADDDVDSWLDGENNNKTTGIQGSASTTTSERIYDGRSSPLKRVNPGGYPPLYTGSEDDGSESEGQWVSSVEKNRQPVADDFFDS